MCIYFPRTIHYSRRLLSYFLPPPLVPHFLFAALHTRPVTLSLSSISFTNTRPTSHTFVWSSVFLLPLLHPSPLSHNMTIERLMTKTTLINWPYLSSKSTNWHKWCIIGNLEMRGTIQAIYLRDTPNYYATNVHQSLYANELDRQAPAVKLLKVRPWNDQSNDRVKRYAVFAPFLHNLKTLIPWQIRYRCLLVFITFMLFPFFFHLLCIL